ncbi:MAG TPA: DUF4390 domain-containing protein [Gemmatimonadales bacterium]|nr:DUF4390 domain-containing protein [Gemmatimonadales bacterium]
MRHLLRLLALLGSLGSVLPAPAVAQGAPRLEVSLSPDSTERGSRAPLVRTEGLLDDPRWISTLRSGFPLRLHYRLELWRSRGSWLDEFQRQVEWDVVVRHEPLLDQYTVSTVFGSRRRESRYAGLDGLAAALRFAYRVAIAPTGEGEYYYTATLQISTLSDSDLEELERFLAGDLGPAAGGDESFGDAVERGAKRFLLRLAGLPSLRLEARSREFRVR